MNPFRPTFLWLIAMLLLIGSPWSIAQNNPGAARLWNLQDADILSVIHEVSQETGKNFVVDPRVNGKITLIASKPIAEKEVYAVFLSILGALGYAAIPSGDVIKIVPHLESGEMTTRLATDKAPGQGDEVVVRVIPLENISATEVITSIRPLLPQWSNISAYLPGNVLILTGYASNLKRIARLIQEIDHTTHHDMGTDVIYLRYLKAKEIAPLLSKVAVNMQEKNSNTLATIQAELQTNALIITAPISLRQALKTVVARLDVRPAQVLIEAVIAEIDEADLKNLGVQWGSLTSPDNLFSPTDGALPTNFPIPGAGNIGIIPNMQIRAVLSLLENINGANILSTPSIVVLDNHKAMIEVGQDVPQQTGSFSTPPTTGGQISPFNTFDRRRVSLRMNVVPQINLGNAVRLGISLKNDSLRNPDNPGINPLINVSQINNDVIVNSNNILVLGGLISNNYNENINKIPILGDIPLLGLLFQQKSRSLQKKTLIAFIKPIILYNTDEASVITHTKYETIRQTQIDEPQQFKNIGQQMTPNILPLWGDKKELPRPFG